MAPPDPRLQLTQFPMVSARAARAPSFRARQAASLIVNDGPGVTSARKSILGTLVELVPANALVLCFVSGQPFLTTDRFAVLAPMQVQGRRRVAANLQRRLPL